MLLLDQTEQKIRNRLIEFLAWARKNQATLDNEWTKGIKKALGELGAAEGYKICASGFREEYEAEWLYDLVWYIEDENKRLQNVPLVVESEWNKTIDFIKFDFEKLLLANSI